MNNKKVKNAKRGGEEAKTIECGKFMKSVWKIHEVARGEGPLS